MRRNTFSCNCALAGALVCIFALVSGRALADGVMLNGISPISLGRGGTDLGFADNGGIIYDNPGAMTNVDGCGLFELGVDMLILDFHYSDPQNAGVTSTEFVPLPQVGIIEKCCDGDLAYGFGIFTPAGFAERYHMQGPFPLLGTHEYESFGSLVKILPAASYRVTDRLSVGGTFGVGYSYAELHGPYFLQSPGPLQGTPLLLRIHGSGATPVWSVGAQYQLTDSTMVGATYQSISSFVLRGDADVTLPSGAHTAYQSTKVDVTWPDSVGVGVKQDLGCCRTFAVDVLWFDWSQTFDRFDIGMRQPSNPLFPNINEQFPLNWKDSVSVRVGFEQKLGYDRVLRLGYVYHPDPIPDGTLTLWIQVELLGREPWIYVSLGTQPV
jgi:long-chain fatty acid transport protein